MRNVFIGDVHGCIAELEELLGCVAPKEGDRLFFLGDLVDRGPESVAVVRRVRSLLAALPGSVAIAGNHEEVWLRAREKGKPLPEWAVHATDDDWRFLDGLPLFHRASELQAIVVHGGMFPRFFEHHGQLGEPSPTWRRDRGKRAERMARFLRVRVVDENGDMVALDEIQPHHRHWSADYDGREGFCFFGHDPQLSPPEPLCASHAMGLDTGCCFGGRLTAAVVEGADSVRSARIVSVPAKARYAEPRSLHEE